MPPQSWASVEGQCHRRVSKETGSLPRRAGGAGSIGVRRRCCTATIEGDAGQVYTYIESEIRFGKRSFRGASAVRGWMDAKSAQAVAVARRFPRWSALLAAAGLAAMLATVIVAPMVPSLLRIDHSSVDLRTALLAHRTHKLHDRVAIVSITDETLSRFASQSPIDRGLIADIVRAVDEAGPRAIGLDVFFIRATDPVKDARLKDVIRFAKAPVILGALDERSQALPEQRQYQLAFHAEVGRKAGYLNLREDRDAVVRYTASPAMRTEFPVSFVQRLAETVEPSMQQGGRRIAWLQRIESSNPVARLLNVEATSPFINIPAHELLAAGNAAAAAQLKDKVVLIGAELALRDRHRTPLSAWRGGEMPGVQIHAQMLAEVLDHRRIVELTPQQAQILLAALGLAGLFAGWRFRTRRFDYLGWGIASVSLIVIDALVFRLMHVSLPFLLTVAAWFAGVTAGHHMGHVNDWFRGRGREAR